MTKKWKKNKKFYLHTYPIFLEHVTPVLYPDPCPYCWVSIGNEYVKKVVSINHSWISPILQQGWELELCLFFKKWRRVHFSPKKGEVGKIIEEWRLLKENNLCLFADLFVYKSKKHPSYIYKSNKFDKIPKMFETRLYVKLKFYITYFRHC